MSHIANELNRLLQETHKTAAEVSRDTGITDAQLSRLKSAVQVWVGPEDLQKLARSFAAGAGEAYEKIHARLLRARLLDENAGPGAKYLRIELQDEPAPLSLGEALGAKKVLPPRVQENLDTIAAHISDNRNVRNFVEVVANLCRSNSTQTDHR